MLPFNAYYEHRWFDWLFFALSCLFLVIWLVYWMVHAIGLCRVFYKFRSRCGACAERGDMEWPGVSIIKPLVGSDTYLSANLESFFTMNYPLYELLICVQFEDDPCIPLVRQLMTRYCSVDARLFIGGKRLGVNPKINNMAPGYDAAKYDLIVISDSCIRMRENTLMGMVDCMTEHVGLVHQMPYVGDPTADFVNVLEKVFFGTCYTRVAMLADVLGINCTTGMSVLMRRQPLDSAGGLRAFSHYLAEDYFMARVIQEAGYQLTLARQPALQMRNTQHLVSFQARLMRWCKLRVAMVPLVSLLEPFTECLLLGVCAALSLSFLLAADALAVFLAHVLSWFMCDWIVFQRVQSGPLPFTKLEFAVAWLVRELMAPTLVARALWDQRIRWHERTFKLRWGGRAVEIAPAKSQPIVGANPTLASPSLPATSDPLSAAATAAIVSPCKSSPSIDSAPQLVCAVVSTGSSSGADRSGTLGDRELALSVSASPSPPLSSATTSTTSQSTMSSPLLSSTLSDRTALDYSGSNLLTATFRSGQRPLFRTSCCAMSNKLTPALISTPLLTDNYGKFKV